MEKIIGNDKYIRGKELTDGIPMNPNDKFPVIRLTIRNVKAPVAIAGFITVADLNIGAVNAFPDRPTRIQIYASKEEKSLAFVSADNCEDLTCGVKISKGGAHARFGLSKILRAMEMEFPEGKNPVRIEGIVAPDGIVFDISDI